MKRIWAICLFEIKRVFRKPASYAVMFGMPLIFTFIFGSLLGNSETSSIKVALVDQDQSLVSDGLIEKLKHNELVTVEITNPIEAATRYKEKKVSGIITIPEGFEKQFSQQKLPEIVFQHGPDLAIAPAVKHAIEDAMAQAAVKSKAAHAMEQFKIETDWQTAFSKMSDASASPTIQVHTETISKSLSSKKMNNLSERAVGFSIMFMMITLMSVTGTILDARKSGVWYRMLSTPVSRIEVLGGYLLSFFLIGWIQFGILMGVSSLLFGVSWGNLFGHLVLVSALLMCVIGLGLFIGGLVRTTEQQTALGNIVIVSTCMLGGIYWPLEIVPEFMQKIAEFVPQTWAMKGFTELVARGGTALDIMGSVAVLLAFAVVFLGAGVTRIRYE
jgi:ABC-2 type transport system permease protein